MSTPAKPALPEMIGSYRVLRKLGEGGMGMVFEAMHEAIQRRVAIKTLHPALAKNEEVIARFFNEARAVNLIGHPGLVQISDLGKLPDGTAYLVMELLQGESLRQRMSSRRGSPSFANTLQLTWQLADCLAAVHAKGIIHRDLKPANIMVVPDSNVAIGERIKILDFGIAKVTEQAGGVQVRTRKDEVLGTPTYMSPEQCRGAGGVDEKTDVYALGVILYEMLCGVPPFKGATPAVTLGMHMLDEPEPLRKREPSIPAPLADCVHRMLAKDKEQRPTMIQAASQLQALFQVVPPPSKALLSGEAPPISELPTLNGGALSGSQVSTLTGVEPPTLQPPTLTQHDDSEPTAVSAHAQGKSAQPSPPIAAPPSAETKSLTAGRPFPWLLAVLLLFGVALTAGIYFVIKSRT